jgi:hypothetical protein
MTPYEAAETFALFEQADDYESLMWRVDMRPGMDRAVKVFARCSDWFAWGSADAEEITKDDIPLLRRSLADLQKADAEYYLAELFASRKRGMRPQKPCYKDMEAPVAALFDACCTDEERAEQDRRDRDFWLAVAASQKDKPE